MIPAEKNNMYMHICPIFHFPRSGEGPATEAEPSRESSGVTQVEFSECCFSTFDLILFSFACFQWLRPGQILAEGEPRMKWFV